MNFTWISLLNATISFFIVACIIFLLIRYITVYNLSERLGHGIAGASSFISIFKQLGFVALVAPFSDLYQVGWRVGWVLLLGGKIWRLEQHRRNNLKAVKASEAYYAAREVA